MRHCRWTTSFPEIFATTVKGSWEEKAEVVTGVGFCLLPPCGLTEMIMVVIEIHTPRRPFAPFPPTKNGIQRTLLPPDREENG